MERWGGVPELERAKERKGGRPGLALVMPARSVQEKGGHPRTTGKRLK